MSKWEFDIWEYDFTAEINVSIENSMLFAEKKENKQLPHNKTQYP